MLAFPDPAPPLVVVLDDDDGLRAALKFALELEGFRVEDFASGEDLAARGGLDGCSCLVIDELLPGITGLETLRRLRAQGVTAPAVLITSQPKPAVQRAAEAAGVTIVEKPLLGDALVRSIRAALAG